MRRGAEFVAAMDERDLLGDRMQVQRPVESRIAAADDEHVLVAKFFHLSHGVEDGFVFIGLDAFDRRLLWLE